MNKLMKFMTAVGAGILLVSCGKAQSEEQKVSPLMQNEDSITNIISQMTLEEKIEMLHGKNMFSSAGVERLGIADMEYADGPFGIREEMEPHSWNALGLPTDSATFFPTGSALAATWSDELAYQYGVGMAKEAKLRGKDMILGPAINIQRVPVCGRTYEYMSEDPELAAVLAVGYTRGAQDNDVAVCLKHFALNNQEDNRGTVDVKVAPRAMHELYLVPFEAAVKEGDAYGVMSAYNKINGYHCSANHVLLNDILRDQWGFKGMVISDWGGVHSTDAAAAGNNVEMPGQQFLGEALLDSVRSGAVSEEVIDQRVREILRVRLAITPVAADQANKVMTSQPETQKIAYDVASKSIVMLKNDNNMLPIDAKRVKRIAVVGDNAVRTMANGGIGAGVKALYEVTPLEGLKNRLANTDVEITYVQGYKGYGPEEMFVKQMSPVAPADPQLMAEAVAAAKDADLVIFVGGDNRWVESEGMDRKSITLPMGQDEVLEAIAAVNPNIVTVIVAGAPTDLRTAQRVSPAMLMSWFNGSEGGNALADVLLGNISPSGRLPYTLPITLEESPTYVMGLYPQNAVKGDDVFMNLVDNKEGRQIPSPEADYSDGIYVGYRWFDKNGKPVLYPFGYGLTYGEFEYSDISAKLNGDVIDVTFTLANNGNRPAEEVVQLYASRPDSQVDRPVKELKAFKRVALAPGESQKVALTVPVAKLRHYDESKSDWSIEPGKVGIHVGASAADIRLNTDTSI